MSKRCRIDEFLVFANTKKYNKITEHIFWKVWKDRYLRLEIFKWKRPRRIANGIPVYESGDVAASLGYLEAMKYSNLKYSWKAIEWAASAGHLNVIKWIHDKGLVELDYSADSWAMDLAAKNGHVEVFKFLHKNESNKYGTRWNASHSGLALTYATRNGHLQMVQYLANYYRSQISLVWSVGEAIRSGHLEIVKWLWQNYPKSFMADYLLYEAVHNDNLEMFVWLYKNIPNLGKLDPHTIEQLKKQGSPIIDFIKANPSPELHNNH